jgi:hypothetical protein
MQKWVCYLFTILIHDWISHHVSSTDPDEVVRLFAPLKRYKHLQRWVAHMREPISQTCKQETLQCGGLHRDRQVNHPVTTAPCPLHLPLHCRLLTVNSCIKVRLELQADKSPVVVKGPFFPRVVNPRYRIRGTNVWRKRWSSKAK